MRLLNVITKQLETFYGDDIPRYAILSHMWSKEEDEVLFKHVTGSDDDRREGEKRKGYSKILAACKQAFKDNWEYIWIDTCCIDKQSSAELSEAINSMYAWYRGSEVCYAYLEDVHSDGRITNKTVHFEESRWFSRGWTLQELIAPRRVVFYSSDWTDIGTKATLRDVISAVTDIRVEVITGCNSYRASVAERISWAAKRRTTRKEDIAYCLMGLLGVHMPLLYGEGTRAFRRLQEEIMKVSDDHSIFAWRAHYKGYDDHSELMTKTHGMLADSPSDFLGAGDVIRSNDESLYPAYSMSNKGLQIGLPVRPVNPKEDLIDVDFADNRNIFKAILDCTYRNTKPTRWVVIYLEMVERGRYVRIFPYWLDQTQINPNGADRDGWVFTPLLVTQVNISIFDQAHIKSLRLRILPTESGYTLGGGSLVEGYSYEHSHHWPEVLIFGCNSEYFGVVIGRYEGLFWMDIIENDVLGRDFSFMKRQGIMSSYNEGGSRYHLVMQHLNSLCVNVSKDCSVGVSGGPLRGHGWEYEVTIDIRRTSTQVPFITLTSSDFLGDLEPRNVHPDFRKEGATWFTIFNPKVQRVLNVSLVQNLRNENLSAFNGSTTFFSPDGNYLAIIMGEIVQIYNITTTSVTMCGKFFARIKIYSVCFSPNRKLLAISAHGGQTWVWDITKRCICSTLTHHQNITQALRFSSDSRYIISVPECGMIQILDITNRTSKDICYLENISSAAISPSGQLVAGVEDNFIRIWHTETKQLVGELQGHSQCVNSTAFTPDGKGLLSGSNDRTLKYWDISRTIAAGIEQSKCLNSKNTRPASSPRAPSVIVGRHVDRLNRSIMDIRHKHTISSVAMSHDGKWIISFSDDNVQFWDSRDGTIQFMLQNRLDSVRSFNVSPAGNMFATHTCRNRIQIWKYDNIVNAGQS